MKVRAAAPMDPAAASAFAAARKLCRHHAKGFFFASAFLPGPKRSAVCAIHAFCQMIRDAIDQAQSPSEGAARVSPAASIVGTPACSADGLDRAVCLIRDRLDEIYDHRLDLPRPEFRDPMQHVVYALAQTVDHYNVPKQLFLDFSEGCRMDRSLCRYATWPSLERHCYHVAGVIWVMLGCVLGLQHSDAHRQLASLGNAMRLTTILRDVKRDLDRGRIYLPLEDLARFKVTQSALARGAVNENFRQLMQFEIARARDLYRQGAEGLCWLGDERSRLTASVMATVCSGTLGLIEGQGYDVFSKRACLTLGQQFRRLAPAWRLARSKAQEPLPDVFR